MVNQGQATKTFRVTFRSKGGTYNAMLNTSNGDLFQRWYHVNSVAPSVSSSDADYKFYPDFTKNPCDIVVTVTSSKSMTEVSDYKVTYYVNDSEITFGTDNVSNNLFSKMFKKTSSGLQVIGNIAKLFSGSGFTIKAKIEITASGGSDVIYAFLPVSVSEYVGGDSAIVSINDVSGSGFRITNNQLQLQLKANVFITDFESDANLGKNYKFKWYQLEASGWVPKTADFVSGTSAYLLTVKEEQVGRYAEFRVDVVTTAGVVVGTDTCTVVDETDPYDINVTLKKYNGSGVAEATNDPLLEDTDPDSSYLEYTATVTHREGQPVAGTVKWLPGSLTNSAGVAPVPVENSGSNKYVIHKSDLTDLGEGDYELVISCEITA